jgi:hypothetical protein
MFFENLPVWKGVIKSPVDQLEIQPFSICKTEYGYLSQDEQSYKNQIIEGYSNEEYNFITTLPGGSNWGNEIADNYYKFILKYIENRPGVKILDIGAGNTFIPEMICSNNSIDEYRIIDPSLSTIPPVETITITKSYFSPENCPETDYDIFFSLNCIEHVSDPYQFLLGARKSVEKKGGKILLVFPDVESPLRQGDYNVFLHEHINYFTPDSFTALVSQVGLEIELLESREDSIYAVLTVSNNMNGIDIDEKEDIKEVFEESLKYFEDLIISFLKKNEKVGFHGACNGLNSLFSLISGWQEFHKQIFLFDGDDSKIGKYLPAFPYKPIISSSDEIYKEMDSVIIAAMSFYQSINSFIQSKYGFQKSTIHPICPIK